MARAESPPAPLSGSDVFSAPSPALTLEEASRLSRDAFGIVEADLLLEVLQEALERES